MSNFILKIIALITMTIDHLGVFIFPGQMIFRSIGRISFILFAFLIVEGYFHTSNQHKYLNRLIKMAIISQLGIFLPGVNYIGNIYFTLSIGLAGLMLLTAEKYVQYLLLLILSYFLPIDYSIYGVGLIGLFYVFTKYKVNYIWQLILFTGLNYFGINVLNFASITYFSTIALVLTWFYSGNRGYNNKVLNELFYWYYPVHIAVLATIGYLIH